MSAGEPLGFSADLGDGLLSAIGDIEGVAKQAKAALKDAKGEARDSQRELTRFEKAFDRTEKKRQKLREKGKTVEDSFTVGEKTFASRAEAKQFMQSLETAASERSAKQAKLEQRKDDLENERRERRSEERIQRELDKKLKAMGADEDDDDDAKEKSDKAKSERERERKGAKSDALIKRQFHKKLDGISTTIQSFGSTATNILTNRAGLGDAKVVGSAIQKIGQSLIPLGGGASAKIAGVASKVAAGAARFSTIGGPASAIALAGVGVASSIINSQTRLNNSRLAKAQAVNDAVLNLRGKSGESQQIADIKERIAAEARRVSEVEATGSTLGRLVDAVTGFFGVETDVSGIEEAANKATSRALNERRLSALFGERFSVKKYIDRPDVQREINRELGGFRLTGGGKGIGTAALTAFADLTGIGETTEQITNRIATKRAQEAAQGMENSRQRRLAMFNHSPQNRINVLEFNQNLRENEAFRIQKTTSWAAM